MTHFIVVAARKHRTNFGGSNTAATAPPRALQLSGLCHFTGRGSAAATVAAHDEDTCLKGRDPTGRDGQCLDREALDPERRARCTYAHFTQGVDAAMMGAVHDAIVGDTAGATADEILDRDLQLDELRQEVRPEDPVAC